MKCVSLSQTDTEMSRNMADLVVVSAFAKALKALCECLSEKEDLHVAALSSTECGYNQAFPYIETSIIQMQALVCQ